MTDTGPLRALVAVVLAGRGGAASLGDDSGTTPTADPPPYRTPDPETVRATRYAALVDRTNGAVAVHAAVRTPETVVLASTRAHDGPST